MIAPKLVDFIHEQVSCRIGVKAIGEQIAVDIPLAFPDGDQCRVFVSRDGEGKWVATDGGSTIMRAAYAGSVNVLGDGYSDRFRQLLDLYGLSEEQGLLKASSESEIGDAVFTIAQACMDVVNLANTPKEKKTPRKQAKFERTLHRIVSDAAKAGNVQAAWHDEKHDPDGLYPVTYRIDPTSESRKPLLIFGANSKRNCMHSTMASLFLKPWRSGWNTIAVYKAETEIPKSEIQRLNEQVDRVFTLLGDGGEIENYIAEIVQ